MKRNLLILPQLIAICFLGSVPVLAQTEASSFKNGTAGEWRGDSNWWSLFNDPIVSELVTSVDVNSQNVKAAEARLRQASASIRSARADFFPTIDATGSAHRSQSTGSADFVFPNRRTNNYKAGFETAYEVDLWGKVRNSVSAAESEFKAGKAALEALKLSLRAEVVSVYYGIRAVDQERAKLDETVRFRKEALQLTQAKLDAGTGNDLDVERAKTELASSEADATALKAQRGQLENSLALLTGQNATNFRLAPASQSLTKPPVIPTGLPSSLVLRRPDVQQAGMQLAAANARIGVAKAAYFPSLRLNANLGWEGNDVKRLKDKESETYGLGLGFSIPLFDGGRRKAAVDGAKAAQAEAESNYQQSVLTAFQEVENALNAANTLVLQREQLGRAVDSAKKAAKLSRSRYDSGLVSYFEVIEADRTVLQLERSAEQLKGQHFRAVADLVKALGGGWSSGEVQK